MAEFEIDFPFTFGDLICYRYEPGTVHDGALLYLGTCHHKRTPIGKHAYVVEDGLIDILDVSDDGHIEHKDPAMWRRCDHFGGFAPGIRDVSGTVSGPISVSVGGVDIPATEWRLDSSRIIFDPLIDLPGPLVIKYGGHDK